MTIYSDSSVLVSLLCARDVGHPASRNFYAAHYQHDWICWDWPKFEVRNAIRKVDRAESHLLIKQAAPRRTLQNDHHQAAHHQQHGQKQPEGGPIRDVLQRAPFPCQPVIVTCAPAPA
ncbi:hypothetical protein [Limisphaera sp. 4302-co]|uniref:hypothetical protein n=1 Tax=Limisphaera sp. 4302-co TaxID=3400417 RepID=UPI003C276F5A